MNNEDNFLLKWNNHQNNLATVFKDWLKDESFVDVTLVCGGEVVSGHKAVLAACSPLLNRILHENPCQHPIIILNDVSLEDLKALLKFIYQGEVSVSQSELQSFLRTADNLQIKGLAEEKEKEDNKAEKEDGKRREKDDNKRRDKEDYKKRQKEDSKKREKDEAISGNVKRQKSDLNTSAQFPTGSIKLNNELSSSHKSQKNKQSNHMLEQLSSCNSQHVFSFIPNSNSANNQALGSSHISCSSGTDYGQVQHYKDKQFVVKTEPLDYAGEMVWQESNSLLNKDSASLEHCGSTLADVDSNASFEQQSHLPPLHFGVLSTSLDNFGAGMGTNMDAFSKSFDSTQSAEGKKLEGDGKELPLTSEEFTQSNMLQTYEDGMEENLNLGSPGKFRGGRKPCCFCGKTFCDNYTLRRHMVTHLSRQRQFECSLCSAAYSRKDHLMAHMRRKHSQSNVECEVEVTAKPS